MIKWNTSPPRDHRRTQCASDCLNVSRPDCSCSWLVGSDDLLGCRTARSHACISFPPARPLPVLCRRERGAVTFEAVCASGTFFLLFYKCQSCIKLTHAAVPPFCVRSDWKNHNPEASLLYKTIFLCVCVSCLLWLRFVLPNSCSWHQRRGSRCATFCGFPTTGCVLFAHFHTGMMIKMY